MNTFYNRAIKLLLLSNGLILISGAMLGPIYALFVAEVGGDLFDASLTGGIFALAAGITSLFSGRLTDKIKHKENIIFFGYVFMGIGFYLYSFVSGIYFLFMVQLLIGFSEAFYAPSFDALYSKHLAKTKRGRVWGAWESMNYFSIAIGAVLGGFIASRYGFDILFYGMALLSICSGLIVFFTRKEMF
jgi:MFS family permease